MNLARSLGSVGGLTLVSRVLALVRDTLQASYVGASFASDAFFVAFRLPNMFRALFAEGAFSAAFIPMFNRKVGEADDVNAGLLFAEQTLAVLLPVLVLFTVVMLIAAWPITWGLSGGFKNPTPEQFAFAVTLSRITIPYLMLISLASLLGGILNSLHKFWVNAAAPILLNLSMIAALWFFHGHGPDGAYETARAQAISVTVGGVLQLAWLVLACKQAGVSLAIKRPRIDDDLRQLLKLILPAALGAGAVQVNLAVSTALAGGLLDPGSISYIYYADRLNQLPLGLIGIGLGTILLPTVSRQLSQKRDDEAMNTQNRGVELALFLTLAGHDRFRFRIRADHPRPFPARAFHCGRHVTLQLGPLRFLARASVLRSREGADAGLLCAARYQNAGPLRDPVRRREPCAQFDPHPRARPLRLRPRRPAAGDRGRVHRQCLDALPDAEKARSFRDGSASSPTRASPRCRLVDHGRSAVFPCSANRPVSHQIAHSPSAGTVRARRRRRGRLCDRLFRHGRFRDR